MEFERLVGFEIGALANLIRRHVPDEVKKKSMQGLTHKQWWIIGYIHMHETEQDVFQKDLEAKLSIRRSTASGILRLMEKKGLILREPVTYDARLKKLVLTPRAVEMCTKAKEQIRRMESKLTQGLTPEDIETFFYIVDKIKRNFD